VTLTWDRVVADLATPCREAGLDLVHAFRVGFYNQAVDDAFKLPDFGRASTLGVLVGNTRVLWPRFLAHLGAEPGRAEADDPLDNYVAAAVHGALAAIPLRWEVRFAPDDPAQGRPTVALQRLAHVSGFAHLSPSHFSVHAVYGPWIALRAAIAIDIDGPESAAPIPPNPCPNCAADCLPKMRRAQSVAPPAWEAWLAVRDSCPVGRAHRYSDGQIRYHATADRRFLAP
jgi:methylmalonic aciduria homocystinuria type C protein